MFIHTGLETYDKFCFRIILPKFRTWNFNVKLGVVDRKNSCFNLLLYFKTSSDALLRLNFLCSDVYMMQKFCPKHQRATLSRALCEAQNYDNFFGKRLFYAVCKKSTFVLFLKFPFCKKHLTISKKCDTNIKVFA